MKQNDLMNECRELVTPEIKLRIDWSVNIANTIYDILKEKDLSQKEFATLMGKTESEISRWLSGTHNFTLKTLAAISVCLGRDILHDSAGSSHPEVR